jgi:hypothetical protein
LPKCITRIKKCNSNLDRLHPFSLKAASLRNSQVNNTTFADWNSP